jgi:hypothetical protein
MVDLAIGVVLLPLRSWLASCSRSGQFVGTLSGEMTIHAILETTAQTLTSLVLCILRRLRCGVSYWLWFLSWLLLHILSVHLLRCSLQWSTWSLHMVLWPLHLKLGALYLHQYLYSVHLWWFGNGLGCEKGGITLLLEDCPGNDIFLFPSFSISLSLLSITMALLIM